MNEKMIERWGYQIFRLQSAGKENEFLVYDKHKEKHFTYSYTRGVEWVRLLIQKIIEKDLRIYMLDQGIIDEKTPKYAVNAIFKEWVDEELIVINNISYDPTKKKVFQGEDGEFYFNIYKKPFWMKEADNLSNYKDMSFEDIKAVIMNLCDNNEKYYTYFIKWLAYQIKNPGSKKRLPTSIIFRGEQGSGKTLLAECILKPIFGENFTEINQGTIDSNHNGELMGKQFVFANEVQYNEKSGKSAQKIKSYVTDPTISVDEKYKSVVSIPNCAHWCFASNMQVPIKIERGNRRFTVFSSKKLPKHIGLRIYSNLELTNNSQIMAFIYHLHTVEVVKEDVSEPLLTNETKDVMEASLNSVELFIDTITEMGGLGKYCTDLGEDVTYKFSSSLISKPNDKFHFPGDVFYELYTDFCKSNGFKHPYGRNQFSGQLKHMNIKIKDVRLNSNTTKKSVELEGGLR